MSASRPPDESVDLDTLMEDRSQYGAASGRLLEDNRELIAELERKKRARKLANVPTDDRKVRAKLREMGEPITLFGEGNADRYDRLRYVLSQLQAVKQAMEGVEGADGGASDGADSSSDSGDSDEEEEFYTEPPLPDQLLSARRKIAEFSLPLSAKRIKQQRLEASLPFGRILDTRKKVYKQLKTTQLLGSQIGDSRPISTIRFSPDGSMLATGSWSGGAKVWSVPNLNEVKNLRGHDTHCRGLAWHPQSTLGMSREGVNLATGGGEGTVKLWSLDSSTPLSTLSGHTAPVARVAFHPSGDYVASASFDGTWRLWDTATSQELLLQEGHSKEVYAIGWQDDGGLVATGGLDAIGRVWDARTGRTVWVLEGHVKKITAMDWSPSGYQLATGGEDDSIKIWDIRKLACAYTIPAHRSLVSDLKFFRSNSERLLSPSSSSSSSSDLYSSNSTATNGTTTTSSLQDTTMSSTSNPSSPSHPPIPSSTSPSSSSSSSSQHINTSGLYLVSSGYDSTIKIWSSDDWQLVKSITTDSGKVMAVDLDGEGKFMAAGSSNRNFQLFGGEDAL